MIESKGHKITPIDGDLAVSRNAEIGRDVDIQGKARVAGSLKVEGFLDAPNIKGAVKGLFVTEEELNREYPNPRPGYCAIVLADAERGFLYLAKNREWEKQSEEAQPFDFIADSINVFASKGELQAERERATDAENSLSERLENEAVALDTIETEPLGEGVALTFWSLNGNTYNEVIIPNADQKNPGMMSSPDKRALDKVVDDIEGLAEALDRESVAIKADVNTIKGMGVLFGGFSNRQTTADDVVIGYKNINQQHEGAFTIPAATTEKAGVMSAEDKVALHDNSAKAGIVSDYTIAPARTNLIDDNVLNLEGYRISLKGLYDQGIRSITFKGCAFTETSTVVAGLIVDSDGNIESYTPYDGTAPRIYTLPLTSKSDWFWGTYRTSVGSIHAWKPTHVFFNSPTVEELKERTALLNGIDENVARIDNLLGNVEESISVATEHKGEDLYVLDNVQEGSLVSADKEVVIVGRNIFDSSTLRRNIIINDSGIETADTASSYYTYYIPVTPKQVLTASFPIEKFYKYGRGKDFIGRTTSKIPENTPFEIPEDTYWIRIQVRIYEGYRMIVYGNTVGALEPFRMNNENKAYPSMSVYTQDRSIVSVTVNQYFNASSHLEEMATLATKVADIASLNGSDLSMDGYIISVPEEIASKLISLQMPDGCKIIGGNIFNVDTAKYHYIKNDNGVEVKDGSSYYTQYIPCAGKGIVANFTIQRLYLYDSSKNFIERTGSLNAGSVYVAPAGVHYVQVQVTEMAFTESDKVMIYYGQGDVNKYTPYEEYTEAPNKAFSIYKEDASLLSITMTVSAKHVFPEIGLYNYWEPAEATDDYACHRLGRDNQSVEGLSYESLLNEYFDTYINKKYSDGYKVIKKGLGNDSGNSKENPLGNEIFAYEFTPARYNHTVLLSAGMNASELSGIFGIAYFIKALMEQAEEGMKVLYNTTRFVVLPCLCPSSLNLSPIKYHNFNTVRINKNFNYKGSWAKVKEEVPGEAVGDYPDSEVETVILKRWINSYPCSDLWIDCHSDTSSEGYSNMMNQVICSDYDTLDKVRLYFNAMKQFYVDKGYVAANMAVRQDAWVTGISGYPKTLYAKEVCGTPAIMIEQYISSTTYGSDGATNNDSYGIKNYTSLIRAYTLALCRSGIEIVD